MGRSKVRYWLVRIDDHYVKNNEGDLTMAKTEAGRLRDGHKDRFLEALIEQEIPGEIAFIPTTYKSSKSEFITPSMWLWINRQQDKG